MHFTNTAVAHDSGTTQCTCNRKTILTQANAKTELNLTYTLTYGHKHASHVAENVTNSIRLHLTQKYKFVPIKYTSYFFNTTSSTQHYSITPKYEVARIRCDYMQTRWRHTAIVILSRY